LKLVKKCVEKSVELTQFCHVAICCIWPATLLSALFKKTVFDTDLRCNNFVKQHLILSTVDAETCEKMCQKIWRANRVTPYCNKLQTASNITNCAFWKTVSNKNLRNNNFVELFFTLNAVDCETCPKMCQKPNQLSEFRHIVICCRRPATLLSALFGKLCPINIYATTIL